MLPVLVTDQGPIPPPSYQRARANALHLDALTLVTHLHLLALCEVAVQMAQRRCPPPLPAGPGGAPRTYREESLLLIALLRTLWRLSYQEVHDWLRAWPSPGLRFESRVRWSSARPQQISAVQALTRCWSAAERNVARAAGTCGPVERPHSRPRSDH